MTTRTGRIYTCHVYEADNTAAAVTLIKLEMGSFSYDDAVVVADQTVVTPGELDPRDNFNHDGWIVKFMLLTGSTLIDSTKTLADIQTECYDAVKAAYATQIT